MDDDQMREAIARENGITLFKQYSEPQAAHILQTDRSTLKRWRRAARVPYIKMGPRKVRYLGIHIVDMLLKGVRDDGGEDA